MNPGSIPALQNEKIAQFESIAVSIKFGFIATCWAVLNFWFAKKLGFSDEAAGEIAFKAKRAMFLVSRKSGL